MPNIATVLKSEISRIARKEVRNETSALKKSATTHRSEIAALKRRVQELERQLRRVAKPARGAAPAASEGPSSGTFRFNAKGLQAHRVRLGLSAREFGLLLGVSDQSVYKWEEGKVRPRAQQLAAIAEIRTLGKREAARRLAGLQEAA